MDIKNMNNYAYSASTNAFYAECLHQEYVKAGNWPDDAVSISDEIYNKFQTTPQGKIRQAGKDGLPVWGDATAQTKEQLIAAATAQRDSLMAEATAAIAPLQDAVDLDMATDQEKQQLLDWKKYRIALIRIDSSKPSWPDVPR